MNKSIFHFWGFIILLSLFSNEKMHSQAFVHPGGLHTMTDLQRMKSKVLSNTSPWADGWRFLCNDSKASNTYNPGARTNVGGGDGTRQRAAKDADAAYFNAIRWYISGDESYAKNAIKIIKTWTDSLNKVNPNNIEMPVSGELFQFPVCHMLNAAEVLRVYPGFDTSTVVFKEFKKTCLLRFYPACRDFLGGCNSWPSWDGPALAGMLQIGVFCDRRDIFNAAIDYYKTGIGGGALKKMVWQDSGQGIEVGRDLAHAPLAIEHAAEMSQWAWNQGVDLFGLYDNRLLKGMEYICKYQRYHDVEWVPYYSCNSASDGQNFYFPSINYHGRLEKVPSYELIYNHYVHIKGLEAPYLRATINLKGLVPTNSDDIGESGLTYSLTDTTTIFIPRPIPAAPANLTAISGASNVALNWTAPEGDVAQGYVVSRATQSNGTYSVVASWNNYSNTNFVDTSGIDNVTYYYKVQAINQSGTSVYSNIASAKPARTSATLMTGWAQKDIGTVAAPGTAKYTNAANNSFILRGSGAGMGGSADNCNYTYTRVTGDYTITARLFRTTLSGSNSDRIGIMVRDSLAPGGLAAFLGLSDTGFRKVWLTTRSSFGSSPGWKLGNGFTWVPTWFRIKCKEVTNPSGFKIVGYQSIDGVNWGAVDSSTIYSFSKNSKNVFTKSYYVGLYVCAGSSQATQITTATFDNVTVEPAVISAVSEVNSKPEYQIFPNPVNNKLNIAVLNPAIIDISSITGSKVYTGKTEAQTTGIDISNLNPGIYFVQINDGTGVVTKKIVKN